MNGGQTDEWHLREYRAVGYLLLGSHIVNLEYADEPTTTGAGSSTGSAAIRKTIPGCGSRLRMPAATLIGDGCMRKAVLVDRAGRLHDLRGRASRLAEVGASASALLARLAAYAQPNRAQRSCGPIAARARHTASAFSKLRASDNLASASSRRSTWQRFDLAAFPGAFDRAVQAEGYRIDDPRPRCARSAPTPTGCCTRCSRRPCSTSRCPVAHGSAWTSSSGARGWTARLPIRPTSSWLCNGDEVVGETTLELLKDGPAITNSTGVRREHRGHGVALAIKLASLQALKELGYKEARTHNDTENSGDPAPEREDRLSPAARLAAVGETL